MAKKAMTLAAGAVCICLLGGTWYLLRISNEKAEQREAGAEAGDSIISMEETDIASVSFQVGGEEVTFLSDEGSWKLEGDGNFPVNESEVENIVYYLKDLRAVRTLTEVEDTEEYGMDTPVNIVRICDTGGKETMLTIGDNNSGTGDDYLMQDEDSSTIYTISSSLRESIAEDLYDYAVSEEIPEFSAEDVVGITVNRESGSYQLQKTGDEWSVTEGDIELSQKEMELAVTTLAGMSYNGYYEYDCMDGDVYGLGDDAAEITVLYEEETETDSELESEIESELESGAETESESESETERRVTQHTFTIRVGDAAPDGGYYVQQKDSREVHSALLENIEL